MMIAWMSWSRTTRAQVGEGAKDGRPEYGSDAGVVVEQADWVQPVVRTVPQVAHERAGRGPGADDQRRAVPGSLSPAAGPRSASRRAGRGRDLDVSHRPPRGECRPVHRPSRGTVSGTSLSRVCASRPPGPAHWRTTGRRSRSLSLESQGRRRTPMTPRMGQSAGDAQVCGLIERAMRREPGQDNHERGVGGRRAEPDFVQGDDSSLRHRGHGCCDAGRPVSGGQADRPVLAAGIRRAQHIAVRARVAAGLVSMRAVPSVRASARSGEGSSPRSRAASDDNRPGDPGPVSTNVRTPARWAARLRRSGRSWSSLTIWPRRSSAVPNSTAPSSLAPAPGWATVGLSTSRSVANSRPRIKPSSPASAP